MRAIDGIVCHAQRIDCGTVARQGCCCLHGLCAPVVGRAAAGNRSGYPGAAIPLQNLAIRGAHRRYFIAGYCAVCQFGIAHCACTNLQVVECAAHIAAEISTLRQVVGSIGVAIVADRIAVDLNARSSSVVRNDATGQIRRRNAPVLNV